MMRALYLHLWVLTNVFAAVADVHSEIARACTVYCYGDILEAVQLSGIYNDRYDAYINQPLEIA